MSFTRTTVTFLTLVGLCLASPAGALTRRVGSDAACSDTDLQSAIDALPAGVENSILVNATTFTSQHVTVDTRKAMIEGGYANCSATAPTSTTTLSGTGHTGDSVLTVKGGSVIYLHNLTISHGQEDFDGHGGGIDFAGHGTLDINNVVISQNYAGYGAGINVDASGGTAVLILETDVVVNLNTAQFSGGGIRLSGDAQLLMLSDRTLVGSNSAMGTDPSHGGAFKDGYGGGIEVVAPAKAYIGSPGYGALAAIYGNTARYGGGISLTGAGSGHDTPLVLLFTTDATRPMRISDNAAAVTGGGIQLEPNLGVTTDSVPALCAFDFRIDNNVAPDGAAIFGDIEDDGERVQLNNFDSMCGERNPGLEFGAVQCASDVVCNRIDGNRAEDSNGQRTAGSIVQVTSYFNVDGVSLLNNRGGRLLRLKPALNYNTFVINNTLMADNDVSAELISVGDDTRFTLENSTLAHNRIDGSVFSTAGSFTLERSIIWETASTTLQQSSGSRNVYDVIAAETSSLGVSSTIRSLDPRFIDPAHGDYHLQAASPAVDASSTGGGHDLDRHPRAIDLPLVANFTGSGDLGAYELQRIDNIVLNSNFDTDLRLWSETTAGVDQWQQGDFSHNEPFVRIYVNPATAGDHLGLKQCVHLPAPTLYELTGLARGGSFFGATNTPRLHWRFFATTNDSCAGTPTSEGDLYFPVSGAFTAPPAPATINVPSALWGFNSAIEITLIDNTDVAIAGQISVASFDAISLAVASDEIFKDGFGP